MRWQAVGRALLGSAAATRAALGQQAESPADWAQRAHLVVERANVPTQRGFPARLVISRPADREPKLGIVFIPWLSCDPVEVSGATDDGYIRFTRDLAQATRAVVVRVEKPGVDASPGPACATSALDDDFAAFRAGIEAVFRRPDVDTTRVFLVGGSIGGAFAVVLAADSRHRLRGVVSINSYARTWYEHMIDHERRRLRLSGAGLDSVDHTIRRFERFYDGFLNDHLSPADVIERQPELRAVWYDSGRGQYGRSAAYFEQVQALPIERALRTLSIPSLFVSSGYDWVMGSDEAARAAAAIDVAHRSSATVHVYPDLSHGLHRFADARSAFAGRDGRYDSAVASDVAAWIRQRSQFIRGQE
jgi:pimeloyl-ACP methyl ester carboxylesterase